MINVLIISSLASGTGITAGLICKTANNRTIAGYIAHNLMVVSCNEKVRNIFKAGMNF